MTLISVLMPVYKPEPVFLEEAVRSILEQDYRDLELVVVEDPSPTNGREVLESFHDDRIKYHLNDKRTSLREQLNLGLSLCEGDYIARMDADDISYPSRIEKQIRYMLAHQEINVLGTNLDYISKTGRSLGSRRYPENHEEIIRDLQFYSPMAHATVIIRKADYLTMGGYKDSAPIEDWYLWCRMYQAGMKFHNIQEPLYAYRQHSGMGKYKNLKGTLKAGIKLKETYFRHDRGRWGLRARLRCRVEAILTHVPAPVVFALFLAHATFIQNRGRFAKKAKESP